MTCSKALARKGEKTTELIMAGFVQDVFNDISLEKNPRLWQSERISSEATSNRIQLLLKFKECEFKSQLQRKSPLAKNDLLSQKFFERAKELSGDKALSALNLAANLGSGNNTGLFSERAKVLFNIGLYKQCLYDIELADNAAQLKALKADCLQKLLALNGHIQKKSPIGFCDNIVQSFKQSCGRYMVATRDISPGELLAVDAPDVKILAAPFLKTHCWHCLGRARAVYPCHGCTGVTFCSPGCQQAAVGSYHKVECGRTDLLYSSNIGVWILAFRSIASNISKHDYVTHGDSVSIPAPELMKEALVSVFIMRLLRAGGFKPEADLQLAIRVHDLLRAITFNCHEVVGPVKQGCPSPLICIGYALNPHMAMFNHSCDPNYGRVWLDGGSKVLAFATRGISKGEEVTDAYSGTFAKDGIEERAAVHERYNFKCACQACTEDWPTATSLPKTIKDKSLKALLLRSKKDSNSSDLSFQIEILSKAQKSLPSPHCALIELEEKLHTLLWAETMK